MPKYVEERERKRKTNKPINKLGKKVLTDKIAALERRRDQLISKLRPDQDYDTRAQIDNQLFLVSHDLFKLRAALEEKNGNHKDL